MAQFVKNFTGPKDGALSYNKPVVLQIIELATKEIAGVASLATSGYLKSPNSFSKKSKRGMTVTTIDGGIIVDIYINVLFGYAVNDVAYRVQENVKRSIESMTEFKVKHINVHILGVLFENNEGKVIT